LGPGALAHTFSKFLSSSSGSTHRCVDKCKPQYVCHY